MNLHTDLQALQPALGELADSGTNLDESMGIPRTFPWSANSAFPVVSWLLGGCSGGN